MALLEVRGLEKVFAALDGRSVHAIDNLALDIDEGEFVSIVGPSGCGKSTFLHIVAGFRRGNRRPPGARRRAHHQAGAGPRHAVPGPVAIPLAHRHGERLLAARNEGACLKAERLVRAQAILGLVDLGRFGNLYPAQLSGGMRQRVALARLIALKL